MSKYRGRSLRLVVDASVARAAGDATASPDATSRAWAATLGAILRICHRVSVCDVLVAEWDRHSGSLFRRWRKAMLSKDKVIHVSSEKLVDEALRAAITSLTDAGSRKAIEKDIHLIELASWGDGWVFTADGKIRAHVAAHDALSRWKKHVRWGEPGAANVPPRGD
ncbi:MAG: hypothetical protein IT478_10305 [Xanthomonadales bacterium]|nr:hypothetical protein [Xanthomonadales bacterium]